MKLNNLPKLVKKTKRLGRGISQGKGKTAGRGTKGQKSRSGFNIPKGFEGGQTRLYRRLPKKRGLGFDPKPKPETVTLAALEKNFENNERVTVKSLKAKGIISKKAIGGKVVDKGELTKTLKFSGISFSESVYKKIIKK